MYSDRNKAYRQLSLQNSWLSQVSSKQVSFFAPFSFQDQISFGMYWCVFKLGFVTDVEQEPEALAGLAFNKHLTFPQLKEIMMTCVLYVE